MNEDCVLIPPSCSRTSPDSLPILVNQLNEGTLDRQLIVSTIRACGELGEATLLKILRSTTNPKIKMAISTVLSWRVAGESASSIAIRIVPYNISDHCHVNPGTMCVYDGDLTPVAFLEDAEREVANDSIEINSRDFMAALQRLLAVKFDKFSNRLTTPRSDSQLLTARNLSSFASLFSLIQLIDPSSVPQSSSTTPPITSSVIKALQGLLSGDENAQVRETAVSTLGLIGMPEVEASVESLYAALSDSES